MVKFRSKLESRILCEFMAALVGRRLALPIPEIAVVEVSPRLSEAILDAEIHNVLATDPGPHFGSLYKAPGLNVALFPVPPEKMPEVIEIFAFDMLIQNVDRRTGKPNMLFDGEQYWLFDHELAFSFLKAIGPQPDPWQLRGMPFVSDHVFCAVLSHYLRDHTLSLDHFEASLSGMDDASLSEIAQAVPEAWRDMAITDRIVAHLITARDNSGLFVRGIWEALA